MSESNLREKVVTAMNAVEMRGQGFRAYQDELADAAIAIALGEAARCAESEEWIEAGMEIKWAGRAVADAIRGLAPLPPEPVP